MIYYILESDKKKLLSYSLKAVESAELSKLFS